jgi:hypothetical protein
MIIEVNITTILTYSFWPEVVYAIDPGLTALMPSTGAPMPHVGSPGTLQFSP